MSKNWIFCIDNPTEEDKNILTEMYTLGLAECLVFQKELASSTVIQLKGFLSLRNPMIGSSLQNLLGNANIQPAKGTPSKIIGKVTKSPRLSGPWYYGLEPANELWADGEWLDTLNNKELDEIMDVEWGEELSEEDLLQLLE